jgi:hypothetical protein
LIEFGERSKHRIGDAKCVCLLSRCTIYVLFPNEHHHLWRPPLRSQCHNRSICHSPHGENPVYGRGRQISSPFRLQLQSKPHPNLDSYFLSVSIHASKVTDSSCMPRTWPLHVLIASCVRRRSIIGRGWRRVVRELELKGVKSRRHRQIAISVILCCP